MAAFSRAFLYPVLTKNRRSISGKEKLTGMGTSYKRYVFSLFIHKGYINKIIIRIINFTVINRS